MPHRIFKYSSRARAESQNRISKRNSHLQKRFGITLVDYGVMLYKQNGVCAICRRKKRLQVDHCHKTGKVRGLLCGNCNTMLGHAKDDENVLTMAIGYLRHVRSLQTGDYK